jgi:hypothetical protein
LHPDLQLELQLPRSIFAYELNICALTLIGARDYDSRAVPADRLAHATPGGGRKA